MQVTRAESKKSSAHKHAPVLFRVFPRRIFLLGSHDHWCYRAWTAAFPCVSPPVPFAWFTKMRATSSRSGVFSDSSVAPFFRTRGTTCLLSVTVVLGGPNVRLLFGGQLWSGTFFVTLCSGVTIERSSTLAALWTNIISTRSTSPTCHRFLLPLFPPARTPSPSDHNIGLSPVTELPSAFRSVFTRSLYHGSNKF
jgi:hypothetical protein